MKTKAIVFIHGMYMNSVCWREWATHFQAKGYRCLAPDWPGRNQPIAVLRKNHPDPQLGQLTLSRVLEHFADTIKMLDEQPILVGHSMGGLIVQLLMQRDLAAAGVAINSAPPVGIFTTKWSFLKSNWPHITPFISPNSPIKMTFERFQYTFVNGLPLAEQRTAYAGQSAEFRKVNTHKWQCLHTLAILEPPQPSASQSLYSIGPTPPDRRIQSPASA